VVENIVEVDVVTTNVVRIATNVVEGDIGANWICVSSMVVVAKLPEPVV
jgi:hypothetical protein